MPRHFYAAVLPMLALQASYVTMTFAQDLSAFCVGKSAGMYRIPGEPICTSRYMQCFGGGLGGVAVRLRSCASNLLANSCADVQLQQTLQTTGQRWNLGFRLPASRLGCCLRTF